MPVIVKVVLIGLIVSFLAMLAGVLLVVVSKPISTLVMAGGFVLFIANVFIAAIGTIYVIATD